MATLEELRKQLVEQRRALLAKVARVEEELRWFDDNVEPEPLEEGQEANLSHLLSRLDDRGRAALDAIEAALARMATGDYGRCVECGKPIAWERLEALPTAATCVDCARTQSPPGAHGL